MHDLQPRPRPTNARSPRSTDDEFARSNSQRSSSSRTGSQRSNAAGASIRSLSSAPSGAARSGSSRSASNRARSADARATGSRSAAPRVTAPGPSRGGRHGNGGTASGGFDRRPLFIVAVAATLLCGLFALSSGGNDDVTKIAAAALPDTVAAAQVAPADAAQADPSLAVATAGAVDGNVAAAANPELDLAADVSVTPAGEVQDLDGSDLTAQDSCLMDVLSVRIGDTGQSVSCVQQALSDGGFYTGTISGTFDDATFAAAKAMQADRDLYVDGIIGRESAISLGVWPDEESFVERTPAPPAGAVDGMGYPLSSVASAGSNAPALPPNSGSGRRIVYDRAGQRVWAVSNDGEIIRSWLVSGSKYSNELPGTHQVYSRSEMSTAWNGKAYLPKMVRWLKTDIGAIGFHSIPLHVSDGSNYQTEAELGTRLSGGCQRQAVRDANFLWDFAQVGTPVIVV